MRIAVVTGAASGIGAAIAEEFLQKNYQVIGLDIQQPLAERRENVYQHFIVDLSKMTEITAFVEKITETIDHVDVLVNCAGVSVAKPFQEMSERDFDWIFAVNIKAPFFLTQKLLPLMTHGEYSDRSIVKISSVQATATVPLLSAYTASKGALSALTRTLALELARSRIRVNAIQPGVIYTPLLLTVYEMQHGPRFKMEDLIAQDAENFPAGRQGTGKDVANAVLFLANEENSFITGESIAIDGGWLARLSTR